MLLSRVTAREPCEVLEDVVIRQRYIVEKLEREGYPCEVQAARRMLRSYEARLATARRRQAPRRR
jgi:hypothetical protein